MLHPIDVALGDVNAQLAKCTGQVVGLTSLAKSFAVDSRTYCQYFSAENDLLWRLFGGVKEIADAGITMTHDVQATISEDYLRRALQGQAIAPVEWTAADLTFTAKPVGGATVNTLPGHSYRQGHAALVISWEISANGAPPERLTSFLEFRLDVRSAWPKVALVPARWVKFYDPSGKEKDALSQVPYGKGSRVQARLNIARQMGGACRDAAFEVPIISSIPLPLNLVPIASIANGAVILAFKVGGLPLRRAPYALSSQRPTRPEDLHLRIKSEVLIEKLAESIRGIPGASLEGARFDGRVFRFTVHIYRKEHECIAEARIHAWINYYAQIRSSGNTMLTFEAYQLNWSARWEIDWCFHKCDEASDEIRKTLENTIPTYAHQSVPIGQFSSMARRARGWMDAFGLNIMLETKQ
ncbi:MAG: hypothetical protein Q7K57_19585 [Burkholderiaceae bacterium]|nr:hypothetical protein [Burkholderiaceae bacterium]